MSAARRPRAKHHVVERSAFVRLRCGDGGGSVVSYLDAVLWKFGGGGLATLVTWRGCYCCFLWDCGGDRHIHGRCSGGGLGRRDAAELQLQLVLAELVALADCSDELRLR